MSFQNLLPDNIAHNEYNYSRLILGIIWNHTNRKSCLRKVKLYGILLPKLFWSTVRKRHSSEQEKLLKFETDCREFAKKIEITWTICSNSEKAEQFLMTECFLTRSWRFLFDKLEKLKKWLGFRNMQEKWENLASRRDRDWCAIWWSTEVA